MLQLQIVIILLITTKMLHIYNIFVFHIFYTKVLLFKIIKYLTHYIPQKQKTHSQAPHDSHGAIKISSKTQKKKLY
jgi:cytochrome b subunit of formate dehydrogenase